ncbi:MAG: hypothetical protein M3163_02815 [Actinomycetota bacterium]|nr:hypothetical protein [Actinomycetota bacterium]
MLRRRAFLKNGASMLLVFAVRPRAADRLAAGCGTTDHEPPAPAAPASRTDVPPAPASTTIPATAPRRGPSGQRTPALTPAYATPASRRVTNLVQLDQALFSARGGETIEVDADLVQREQIVFRPGPAREQNVLIRPPLGQRRRLSEVRIRQDHLTVAGFDLLGAAFIGDGAYPGEGSFSGYWRCTQARSALLVLSVQDAFLVECVGYEDDHDDDSRVTIYGYQRWAVERLLIDGCWWGVANFLVPGSSAHVDGIHVEGAAGGGVRDITIRDSVLAQGAGVSALLKPNGGYLRWINNWSSKDRVTSFHALSVENLGADVTVTDSDINGHITWVGRQPISFKRNRLRRINVPVDATNVVDESGAWPMDELADLTSAWPECPWRRP